MGGTRPDGYARRKAEFRTRILDAAVALLREEGAEFTTRALAARAGVSDATPFNHFGSKRGIFAALVDRTLDDLAVRLADTKAPRDPLRRVFAHGEIITTVYADDPAVYRPVFGFLFQEADEFGERLVTEATDVWRLQLDYARDQGALRAGRDLAVVAGQLEVHWLGGLNVWVAGGCSGEEWLDSVEYGTTLALASLVVEDLRPGLERRLARLEKKMAAR